MSGRCQYEAQPQSGEGAMKFVDSSLPQPDVRVGPTETDGVGLGYLIGFELDPEQINALAMATKVELAVTVLKTSRGGTPSPLKVALLSSAAPKDPKMFSHFGAWNNAPQLKEVGEIEGDAEIGEARFDVTDALLGASPATANNPLIYFGIFGPQEDLVTSNSGRHVHFGGETTTAPRLILTE